MSDHPLWILLDSASDFDQPEVKMADNYVNLPVNQPAFNWDSSNVIKEWKWFCGQVELLLVDCPYSTMNEKMKVATLKNWMTDSGQKIFNDELIFPMEGDNKKDCDNLQDVFNVFEAHFTSLQSMIHSWYNLGALHSHHCRDQLDFM